MHEKNIFQRITIQCSFSLRDGRTWKTERSFADSRGKINIIMTNQKRVDRIVSKEKGQHVENYERQERNVDTRLGWLSWKSIVIYCYKCR